MEDKKAEVTIELKPGETIHPSTRTTELPPVQPVAPVLPVTPVPAAPVAPVVAPAPAPQPPATPAVPPPTEPSAVADDPDQVSWTASEFIDHAKSFDWYLGLAVAGILSSVALHLLFKDIITSVTPVVAALALGFYGRRRPRQLQYRLDSQGLTIGGKFFPYAMFRSFAVMEEGPFASIAFLPLKRFGMLTTVYLDPADENRIIDLVNQFLPFEPRDHDPIERLMKRIRF